MFGLTPLPMYAIVFLIFSNVCTFLFWQFADSKADRQEAIALKCAAEHKATMAQVDAMGRIAKEHAKEKEAEHAKNSAETSDGWAAALGVVRADAARRVRESASRSAGSGSVPEAGPNRPGNAETNADAIPAPERVAQDCAETTVTANFLQTYIERLEKIDERSP